MTKPSNSTRLNKYVSDSGVCSRREADRFIEQGKVFVNGRKAKIADQVFSGDTVTVNGIIIEPQKAEDAIFIALNKPVGIVSTTENVKDNIVTFVNHSKRIFPIGRLDKDSQGLIFLTSDGDIVNKILRAGNKHEKEYLVTVNKPITDGFISAMVNGVPMMGVNTRKCEVFKESTFVFRIILIQGLNRQIRRMCEHFGYEVVKLERIRIMNISLKKLPLGDWRDLTPRELEGIFSMIEHSVGTEDVDKKSKKISDNKGSNPNEKGGHKKSNQKPKSDKKSPAKDERRNPDLRNKRQTNKPTGRGKGR
jgi:23S rRNA pseudouridine2604 synthase